MAERDGTAGIRLEFACVIVGAVLAATVVLTIGDRRTQFSELGLGRETSGYLAKVDGHQMHCLGFEKAEDCIGGFWAAMRQTGRQTAETTARTCMTCKVRVPRA